MVDSHVSAENPLPLAPQVTINRELTDLDSSNAFEGPEKLLEVWFAPSADALSAGARQDGLKAVTPDTWTAMLDLVNCKVLSIVESDHVDAYLLSESSMFVWPHKLILKTCGTTTLLLGLRQMLQIAAVHAKFPVHNVKSLDEARAAATPYRVFYSRKNFLFPEKQHGPHRSWIDEVKYLDGMFSGGSAYMIGKMNGGHWYLYITEPNLAIVAPAGSPSHTTETKILQIPNQPVHNLGQRGSITDDETLEILMTDLDPTTAKQFYLDQAIATAEDHFPRMTKEARKEAHDHLGGLTGLSMTDSTMSGTTHGSVNDTDVFSYTLSENGINTPDESVGCHEESVDFQEKTTEGHALGTVVSETCGLSDVYPTFKYPDARVDAYLFNPCGFSANGVIPAPDQAGTATHYFTVHVTPEPQCSYASFETNVPGRQSGRETIHVIRDVVNIFKPGRFSVTLFEAKPEVEVAGGDSPGDMAGSGVLRSARTKIPGYKKIDRIVHEFDGYEVVFRYYERDGWEGGAPVVGEIDL